MRGSFRAARAILLVELICAVSISALAQSNEDPGALSQQIVQLMNESKYKEAIPLAQRALALAEREFGPNHPEVGAALNNLAELYEGVGRYAEAEPLFRRDLAITEKVRGPDHPDVALSLNNLALLYDDQGRYAEAEPLAKRSLAIREKSLGPNSPEVANSLNSLGAIYDNLGRYPEAEPLYVRSLGIRERVLGPDHPDVGSALNNLGSLYESEGRYDAAEPLYKRAAAILEKALGPDDPNVGATLNNLALLYKLEGRYAEAEPLYKRDRAINEKAFGVDHPNVAGSIGNLAMLYYEQGRYAEAEPLFKTSLEKRQRALGDKNPAVATALNNLAGLYYSEGRYEDAKQLLERSLTIRETTLGPDHPDVGNGLNNLAGLYSTLGREDDAEPLLKRALAITEKTHGRDHPTVATPLNNLALLYTKQGHYADAGPLAVRALNIREKALGPQHPDVAISLNTLGRLYDRQGRHSEAEALYKRSISIFESAFGPDHSNVTDVLNNLAALYFERQDWQAAANTWQQSTERLIHHLKRGNGAVGRALSGDADNANQDHFQFEALVETNHHLAVADKDNATELAQRMFQSAQWAQSSDAAASLALMSARQATGTTKLAGLIRERQDLVAEWHARDKLLISLVSNVVPGGDSSAKQVQRSRLVTIDARLHDIDLLLEQNFPDYSALAAPDPVSIADIQSLLRADEALVLFLNVPTHELAKEETFVWVVTKADVRWLRLDPGERSLAQSVAALRCGLDDNAWRDDHCAGLLKTTYTLAERQAGGLPPFDLAVAHTLYKSLFGQTEDLIKDKHLLIVPSGALTALPFQVLVTEKPANAIPSNPAQYAKVAWLAKSHAITVLPSVASLKALRQFAKASKAASPYIGFGNPLLLGPHGNDHRAWQRLNCKSQAKPAKVASRGVAETIPEFFQGGLANVEVIRSQHPLPETADEVCAVARATGASDDAVYLGARATETTLKALSTSGALANARVLHLATHGLLAGETELVAANRQEPALILTPPEHATEQDDGLLTASEVAQLKLDADWVVLSACNTAAGGSNKPGTEALSGLARAFFYAGARALLVSHWAVNSDATVKLITQAFAELKADPTIGKAEALRRSMISLISRSGDNAHPVNWAPFVVVGGGSG